MLSDFEKKSWVVFAGVVAVLLVVPFFTNNFLLNMFVFIFYYAYLGQAWNILGGYAGQFSFGHVAFVGIGAYTSTLLGLHFGFSPWIGMVAAGFAGLAFGLFCGFLSFRYGLKGPYFALVMLAFAEMLRVIGENWTAIGASEGLGIPLKGGPEAVGHAPLQFQFATKVPYYFIALAMMVAIVVLTQWIQNSRLGYYFQAIREDEEAAEAIGVNAFRYKMIAMGISAFLSAMGGTFNAQYLLNVDPEHIFGVQISVDVLLRPIIGGAGTVFGPVLGSFILTPLPEITKAYFRDYTGMHLMAFGAILVAVIIFLPKGLMGLIEGVYRRFSTAGRTP